MVSYSTVLQLALVSVCVIVTKILLQLYGILKVALQTNPRSLKHIWCQAKVIVYNWGTAKTIVLQLLGNQVVFN